MRAILNISLPQAMSDVVDEAIVSGNYATKSEFFRNLIRMWMEERAIVTIENSRSEIRNGKGKVLKSLKDLR